MYTEEENENQFPEPRPRKLIHLWQAHQQWNEMVEMRKRHVLRISSIEKGRSKMDAQMEHDFLDRTNLDNLIQISKKIMINYGSSAGLIWDWLVSIRGLSSGSMAAQLLAQVDDISRFDTVSKLWRYAGQAVFDGVAETNHAGEKAHKNSQLQALCYNIEDVFIKHQTPGYAEIYYDDKQRLRQIHPEQVKNTRKGSRWPYLFTDMHIHRMAKRKMIKIFLSHFWVKWREFEGLPVTPPYIFAIGGHTHCIEPFSA